MSIRALVPMIASLLALAAMPASASCAWTGAPEVVTPATGVSYATLVLGDADENEGTYYVDNDPCQPGCVMSVWIYEETNGIPGLQRGDEVVDDTCGGMIPPDTLIF